LTLVQVGAVLSTAAKAAVANVSGDATVWQAKNLSGNSVVNDEGANMKLVDGGSEKNSKSDGRLYCGRVGAAGVGVRRSRTFRFSPGDTVALLSTSTAFPITAEQPSVATSVASLTSNVTSVAVPLAPREHVAVVKVTGDGPDAAIIVERSKAHTEALVVLPGQKATNAQHQVRAQALRLIRHSGTGGWSQVQRELQCGPADGACGSCRRWAADRRAVSGLITILFLTVVF
jgi:hypothetical protein